VKGFFFRLGVIILIITAVIGGIYSEALVYRRDTFSAAYGDVMYDSMIFSDITACSSSDGKPQLVIGGTVYPDNNRNAQKNVFFKLYSQIGALVATSGINEKRCSLLLNDIEKTSYGFAVICEVRAENENFGKIYEYSHDGTFINSTYIKYADFAAQEAGSIYGMCTDGEKTYYTAIDSEKTVCTDSEGKYLYSVPHQKGATVCDAVISGNIVYTAGNIYDSENIPKAYLSAFDTAKKEVSYTSKDLIKKNDTSEYLYSQTEDITIITEKGMPVSLILYGKYFDSASYKKYIRENNIEFDDDYDTVAKKSIRESLPMYRTGRTAEDYINAPYPSAFFISADLSGKIKATKLFESDTKCSYSSISATSTTVADKENFSICLTCVDTVSLDTENFNTVIKGFDSTLTQIYETSVTEPTEYKTFFTAYSKDVFFTFTTINTSGSYSAKAYTVAEYKKHISRLKSYTDDICFINNVLSLVPVCIMVSLFYILTRIRCLQRGLRYIPQSFFQNLFTQLTEKILK